MTTMNDDIQTYVEKYARDRGITVEEAYRHKVVRQYIKYVRERGDTECPENKETINVACGVDES